MRLLYTQPAAEDLLFLRSLYEDSFPSYERRTWEQLTNLLSLPAIQVVIARQEKVPVGFAIFWQVEGWCFLEHLAVHPQQEGKGYGSQMMKWLLQQSNDHLLLEVELPIDEKSRRRIRFYQQLGFQVAAFPYQQPPYRRGEATPAMHILSIPTIQDTALFELLTTAIRQQVFEAFS